MSAFQIKLRKIVKEKQNESLQGLESTIDNLKTEVQKLEDKETQNKLLFQKEQDEIKSKHEES